MDGWTRHQSQWWYVAFLDGVEYWFEWESEGAVSFAFGRDVEKPADELISPSDIDELPERVTEALDEDDITLRRRAESLREVMT